MRSELGTRARTLATLLHGHRAAPAVGLAAAAALVQQFGPATIALPSLFSLVEARTTLTVLCALGFALATVQVTNEPAAAVAATSARGWTRPRLIRLAVTTSLSLLLAMSTAPAPDVAVSATLVFTAEALLTARLLGTGLAWILPTAHLLAAIVFGTTSYGQPQPWAWFLATHATPLHLTTGLAGTLACLLLWSRGPAHE